MFAMVDAEKPDLKRFPAFARAAGVEAVLEPGDALFLPCHWYHYVKQFEGDQTLSLNFWFGQRKSRRGDASMAAEQTGVVPSPEEIAAAAVAAASEARAPPAAEDDDQLIESGGDDGLLSMQIARHLERQTESMLGSALAAGQFLKALAHGEDSTWPAGSHGRSSATEMRKHMITVLGASRANALLRAMSCHGRLYPGLAPHWEGPVVGTEQLQHTPSDQVRQVRAKYLQKMIASGYIEPEDLARR